MNPAGRGCCTPAKPPVHPPTPRPLHELSSISQNYTPPGYIIPPGIHRVVFLFPVKTVKTFDPTGRTMLHRARLTLKWFHIKLLCHTIKKKNPTCDPADTSPAGVPARRQNVLTTQRFLSELPAGGDIDSVLMERTVRQTWHDKQLLLKKTKQKKNSTIRLKAKVQDTAIPF